MTLASKYYTLADMWYNALLVSAPIQDNPWPHGFKK